jgi:hypothetical protein
MSARLSNVLRLHKPSSSSSLSAVESEHMKRVWWTVYCLDRMTSTEMGLPPIFRRDEVELSYPSDQMLPTEAADEFSSGVAFTTQVQLAFIHTDICQTVRSLGDTGMIYDQKRAEPIIQQLETLRAQMPPTLSFDVENGLPTEMREMKNRSLVSLYERYYQVNTPEPLSLPHRPSAESLMVEVFRPPATAIFLEGNQLPVDE